MGPNFPIGFLLNPPPLSHANLCRIAKKPRQEGKKPRKTKQNAVSNPKEVTAYVTLTPGFAEDLICVLAEVRSYNFAYCPL